MNFSKKYNVLIKLKIFLNISYSELNIYHNVKTGWVLFTWLLDEKVHSLFFFFFLFLNLYCEIRRANYQCRWKGFDKLYHTLYINRFYLCFSIRFHSLLSVIAYYTIVLRLTRVKTYKNLSVQVMPKLEQEDIKCIHEFSLDRTSGELSSVRSPSLFPDCL